MSQEKIGRSSAIAIRLTREIFAQEAFQTLRFKHEIQTGAGPAKRMTNLMPLSAETCQSDLITPCGTCRMGRADDPAGGRRPRARDRRRRAARRRTVRSFADHQRATSNGASFMVGEKISDHVLALTMAGIKMNAPWIPPRWKPPQR